MEDIISEEKLKCACKVLDNAIDVIKINESEIEDNHRWNNLQFQIRNRIVSSYHALMKEE